jgi:hypothetical protein
LSQPKPYTRLLFRLISLVSTILLHLTIQRWRTFKLLCFLQTEEFKFPTSSVPSSIHGVDLRFFTCVAGCHT